mgnify:CR=1 FL=1
MEEKDESEPQDDGADLPRFFDQIQNNIVPIARKKINKGLGYCPIPPQSVIDGYILNYTKLISEASGEIHTNDRYNWRAYNEKLVDIFYNPSAPITNDTWAGVVGSSFEIEYWPYIQSN